jgi:Protein of unknown function (DUF1153)
MPQGKKNLGSSALPSATDRWVISRKAALIEAVHSHAITIEEACRYQLSIEEFAGLAGRI